MTLNRTILALFGLLLNLTVLAQKYPFVNLTVDEGLAEAQVLALAQDARGRIWMGSNNSGISVFDGKQFSYFTLEKDSLVNNLIYDVERSPNNDMWVAANGGVSVYSDGSFINYDASDSLSHDRVMDIYIESADKVWLATGAGISIITNHKKDQKGTVSRFEGPEAMNGTQVFKIRKDSEGNLWFCTVRQGVFRYDGSEFKQYTSADGLPNDIVYDIAEVEPGRYWILTHIGAGELVGDSIKKIEIPGFEQQATFFSILKDSRGEVWLSTNKGVFVYSDGKFELFTEANGLVNNSIWRLFEDREGNVWLASLANGISRLDSRRFRMWREEEGLINSYVQAIYESPDGTLWMGTQGGLSVKEPDGTLWMGTQGGLSVKEPDGTVTNYNSDDGLVNNIVWTIKPNVDGKILIGTAYGFSEFDGTTFRSVDVSTDKTNLYIYDIIAEPDGKHWLATRGGVSRLMGDSIIDQTLTLGLPQDAILDLYRDQQSRIWMAGNAGLFCYDGEILKHFDEKDGFITEKVRGIVPGADGALWFTTSSGIYRYVEGEGFINFNEEDGLLSNAVYSLNATDRGYVWIGVTNGVNRILLNDAKTAIKEIRHYGPDEGFEGMVCNNNAILQDSRGHLLIGSERGLVEYLSQHDRVNSMEPITYISGIRLFSQKTDWSALADSVDKAGLPVNLALDYDQNYFAFDFVGVSHSTPNKVEYQYQLVGFDEDWLPVTEKRSAVYSNLPFGTYTFQVKANNGNDVWNVDPVTFTFTIRPPFWRTWWFYSLCFLAFALAVWSYLRIRSANKKITAQKNEIEEQKEIIELKNQDMLDSIRYAQRIQKAILPPDETLHRLMPESFVLYKPKDIVSGDFYWLNDKEGKMLFAAVDCTGHGVPGAMVSVVGANGLNDAIKEVGLIKPANILTHLNKVVKQTLHTQEGSNVRDGMDLALCSLDRATMRMEFAGANNPLYLIRKANEGDTISVRSVEGVTNRDLGVAEVKPTMVLGEFALYELKGNKQAIGDWGKVFPAFTNLEFDVRKDDTVYVFSDGYADQFGGPRQKKFKYKPFKKLLLSMQNKQLKAQHDELDQAFEEWRGDIEQIDDVCIIGLRI